MEALVAAATRRKHAACEAYALALAELECSVEATIVPALLRKQRVG